jgi:hypothetical protein
VIKNAMAVTFLLRMSKPGVCNMAVREALSWKKEIPFIKIITPRKTLSKVSHLGL